MRNASRSAKKLPRSLGETMRKHNGLNLKNSAFRNLFEQEEEKSGAEEAGDDLFGGGEEDKGDEDKGDEPEAEDTGDEGADKEEDKADEKDKEDDKLKISAEDKARLGDSIDDELEGLMVDYETDARKSAQVASEKMKSESAFRSYYRRLLKEVAADDIDLKHFANNLARLVKNYDTLMDMESIILNKAYSYIQNNYGEDTVKALKDTLEQDFDIDVERGPEEKDEPEVPIAVGASGEGGAGA